MAFACGSMSAVFHEGVEFVEAADVGVLTVAKQGRVRLSWDWCSLL